MFPEKAIPIAIKVNSDVEIDRLIKAIKQSEFLSFAKNLKFDWCLKHYTQIIEGQYKDFKKSDPMLLPEKHTPEELASLIIPIDEIEI